MWLTSLGLNRTRLHLPSTGSGHSSGQDQGMDLVLQNNAKGGF